MAIKFMDPDLSHPFTISPPKHKQIRFKQPIKIVLSVLLRKLDFQVISKMI